jgi:negative regulator of flagellin synthesis FlgM
MQLNGKGRIDSGVLGSITPVGADRKAPAPRGDAAASGVDRPKQDTVSFSDEARALADGSSTLAAASAERLADVKQRVMMGAYNTAEMAGEVARRILQRGDL